MALDFHCYINGTEFTIPQLKEYEYDRTIHMLHELKDLGAKVQNGGKELSHRDINWLEFEDAHRISVQTRLDIGQDGLEALLLDNLKDSEKHWKEFNTVPIEEQGYNHVVDEFVVTGMPLPMMLAEEETENDDRPESTMLYAELRQKLEVFPEHYIPGRALADGNKGSVEVVGMYGEQICMVPGKINLCVPEYLPYKQDPDFDLCTTVELNFEDGTPINLGVTHEFALIENGFKQKSTYFCPKNAPKTFCQRHQIHFAIEMYNDYAIAYENYTAKRKAKEAK